MLADECIDYEKLHCSRVTYVAEMGFVHVRWTLVSVLMFLSKMTGFGTTCDRWFSETGIVCVPKHRSVTTFFGEGDLNRRYCGRKLRWVVNVTLWLFHPRVRTRFVYSQRLTTVRFEFLADDDRGWLYPGYQVDCFQFKCIARIRNE